MSIPSQDSLDWEHDIYAKGKQVNRWPFSELVADAIQTFGNHGGAGRSVLEVGCGAGNNLWFFLEQGFHVAGIDVAPTAIKIADQYLRSREFSEFDLRCGSAEELPWPNSTFDLVVDRGTLTQMTASQVQKAVQEVSRVLRPGGFFFSYYLLGKGSDDSQFGVPLDSHTMKRFTSGAFKKLPLTTFFSDRMIEDIWQHYLQIKSFKKTHIINSDGSVEERFTVLSVK